MERNTILLIGAPVDSGKQRKGCLMGPDSLRTAGLPDAIGDLGYTVRDLGNLARPEITGTPDNPALVETAGWCEKIAIHAQQAMENGLPVFLGGDHALSLGSVSGVARYAAQVNRPLFVLWVDAHSDFHTPHTSTSGNLHGTPLGYVSGLPGFDAFPPMETPVPMNNIYLIGIRSIDTAERTALTNNDVRITDMRSIDENGISAPLRKFLEHVAAADGLLHVSLDVDFMDPSIAPAVGTTVPGGATFREAHLVMEILHDSKLVTSLDLVELNPFLDEHGRTARLMVDLAASLFGRRVLDRPTPGY
jgi:arginase